jgi:hypothetical protein
MLKLKKEKMSISLEYQPFAPVLCSPGQPTVPPWPGSSLVAPMLCVQNFLGQEIELQSASCASQLSFDSDTRQRVPPAEMVIVQQLLPRQDARSDARPWSYVCVVAPDGSYDLHGLLWNWARGYYFARAPVRYNATGAASENAPATSLIAQATHPVGPWPPGMVGGVPWICPVRLVANTAAAPELELASLAAFAER